MSTKTRKVNETAQRCADAYLELAQELERTAARFRRDAKGYRSGELLTNYTALTTKAAIDASGHPAQRAIDGIGVYNLQGLCETLRAQLKA